MIDSQNKATLQNGKLLIKKANSDDWAYIDKAYTSLYFDKNCIDGLN